MIDFQYSIVRRPRRKTAAISVSPDDTVTVTVPQHVTDEQAREFVQRKYRWIKERIRRNAEARGTCKPRSFCDGEEFLHLGEPCTLRIEAGLADSVVMEKGVLRVFISPYLNGDRRTERTRDLLIAWYKGSAARRLEERLAHYAGIIGVEFNRFRVRNLQSRWGSCSSKKNLNFTWQIVMAPLDVLDYVVVHELCHLVHLNHSPEFWGLVESVLPDYMERRRRLRAMSNRLVF